MRVLGLLPIFFCTVPVFAAGITYHRDVLPILQNRCAGCHRSGEIAPMAFSSYKDTRPWAKAIKEAVLIRKMPPWFADPAYGHFANDRSLSRSEIDTLVAWADSGAPEGDPKTAPRAREYAEGWNIPQPDLVIQMPKPFQVPASGAIDYQYIVVPTGFTEDKWVQMIEVRPTNRAVVHHLVAYIRGPKSKWLRGEAEPGIPFVPPKTLPDGKPRVDTFGQGSDILSVYVPGQTPDSFRLGQAKLIPAGSDLVFQMHYTANGKAAEDQTRIGLILAKEPPRERVVTAAVTNSRFALPPRDPNFRVDSERVFANGGTLISFNPHMHVRGKGFEYRLTEPGEEPKILLHLTRYDFNWQLTYKLEQPIVLKPGAVLAATAWFDNSPNNPKNPDPNVEVHWGEQSWEEMMVGFFDVAMNAAADPGEFLRQPRPAPRKAD